MEERGALSSVTSLIDAAQQRARVDRVPTAVLFYNELVSDTKSSSGAEQHRVVRGKAVAIRRSGRITRAQGSSKDNLLFDEFADLDKVYSLETSENKGKSSGMRLYQFVGMDDIGNGNSLRYSVVHTEVVCEKKELMDETLPFYKPGGSTFNIWSAAFRIRDPKNTTWKTGQAYAFEFANVSLPNNYFFKSTAAVPTSFDDSVKFAGIMVFDPGETDRGITSESGGNTIEIFAYRPSGDGLRDRSIGKTGTNLKEL
jgi:hypothetical protein